MKTFFPILLMVLDAAAAVVYFYQGDWRRGLYWLCATIIIYTVTF